MNKCTCDQCKQTIRIDLEKQKHKDGIVETFFSCPHCDYRYLVTVTDREVRRRIKHFATEWAKMSKLKNGKEWKKEVWMKKYKRLQRFKAETDSMINKLKEKFI